MSITKDTGTISHGCIIRPLTPEDAEWATAVSSHGGRFHSPLWSNIYPDRGTEDTYRLFACARPLMLHCIESGMSLGAFDTRYRFRRAESEAVGGKLYWDPKNREHSGQQLLEEMDFPLVHVALAFNADNPPTAEMMADVLKVMPLWTWFSEKLSQSNHTEEQTHPSKVLKRVGTDTRYDYTGKKIMRQVAHFQIGLAKKKGYTRIDIDSAHPAVTKVWMNPPIPHHARMIDSLDPEHVGEGASPEEILFAKSAVGLQRIEVIL